MLLLRLALILPPLAFCGTIGTITVDQYSAIQLGNGAAGLSGVSVTAHYTVSDPAALSAYPEGVQWIQVVSSSEQTGFTPEPNRPFIDPRTGQSFGEGFGDGETGYDATYTDGRLLVSNRGRGPYLFDAPAVLNQRAASDAYEFVAHTLLVTAPTGSGLRTLSVLGGFRWGFTVVRRSNTRYSVERAPLLPVYDDEPVLDLFNDALAIDFPGHELVGCSGQSCVNNHLTLVPEPSTTPMLVLALSVFALLTRRSAITARLADRYPD